MREASWQLAGGSWQVDSDLRPLTTASRLPPAAWLLLPQQFVGGGEELLLARG